MVPIDKLSVVITLVLAFIFLHEQFTVKSFFGCVLIGATMESYFKKSLNFIPTSPPPIFS